MTMEREPVQDVDDTVIRARPRADAPVGGDIVGGDIVDDDPLGDTVVRPGPGARRAAGPSVDDTVVRPGQREARPVDGPGWSVPAAVLSGGLPVEPSVGPPTEPPVRRRTPSLRVGGRVVRLDRSVVIGRRPAAPRIVHGDAPTLLTVPSPSGQVSSTHLHVHAEGEAVVVEDLRSTNGTVVRPPGAAPFRMAAGASIVVLTGTLVEIGDGNVVEVLSPHLRPGPDDGLPPFPPAP